MEELSMCTLLLLDAAKRTDHEFDTPYHSSRHTTKSADDDVNKMVKYLIEERVTQQSEDGAKITFVDPLVIGMQKLVDGWLKKFLVSSEELDVNTEDEPVIEVELNHELHNTFL
jgi:chromosome condensin MukBEF complex kleisin-like MukF subunit